MNLKNLNEDLNRILPDQPPVLELTLHSMYALCLDIQKHCNHKIYNGVVNDYRQLNNVLTQMANLLCKIYDTHSSALSQNTNVTFPEEKLRQIEQKTRDVERNILDQKDGIAVLEKAQSELENQLAREQKALAERQAKDAQVRKLRDALEAAVSQLDSIDLPALEQEKADLESRKARMETRKSELADTIARLKRELTESQESCCGNDSACTRLTGELAACREKLAASETRLAELNTQLNQTATRIRDAETHCGELEQKNTDADARLAALTRGNEDAQDRLARTDAQIAAQQAVCDGLLPRLNASTDTLSALNAQIDSAQATIDANNTSITAGREKLPCLEETIRAQSTELDNLGTQIDRKNAAIAALHTQIAQRESEKAAAEESLSAVQAEEARLAGLVHSAQAEEQRLKDLSDTHKQVLVNLADIGSAIKSAEEELAFAKIRLLAAEGQRDDLRIRITGVRGDTEALDRESEELRPQYEAAEQVRLEKQQNRDEISGRLTAAGDAAAALDLQAAALTEKLEQTNLSISRKNDDITRLGTEIAQAEQEHNNLLGQVAVLQEDLILQQEKNDQFCAGELKTVQDALDAARNSMQELTDKRDSMKQERSRLMSEESRINGEISTLNVLLLALKPKLDKCTQELQTVQAQYEEKKNELDVLYARSGSISQKLEALVRQIEETRAAVESDDNAELEAKYAADLAELQEKNEKLEQMRRELPGKSKELADLKETYRQVLGQKTQAEETFRRLSEELQHLQDPQIQERVSRLDHKSRILEEVRTRILTDAARLQISGSDVGTALDWNLQNVNATLEGLRTSIQNVTGVLSDSIL